MQSQPQRWSGGAAQQQQPQQPRWGGGGSGSSRGEPRWQRQRQPACLYFRKGHCRFGATCRFSHDPQDQAAAALPFQDRQLVQSQADAATAAAAAAAAASASAGSSSNAAPWRFRVMSYNILADHLAHEHAAELYTSAPRFSLQWSYRSGLIVREILHHRPDVVCLQEVDHFRQMKEALQPHGYEGMYTKRTGDRRDGLAMFWRADVMQPVKERTIHFNQLGMKDNVAQLVAFRRQSVGSAISSRTSSEGSVGSLTGQKRRQAEQGRAGSSSGAMRRHLRFGSSSSESEGEEDARQGHSFVKRRGSAPGIAAEAVQAISLEDAAEPGAAAAAAARGPQQMGVEVEDATQAAGADDEFAAGGLPTPCLPSLVVSNIHVLFNPKRGDLKMGQVRTLLEHVDSLCLQQQKRTGQQATAVICGDFNSAAGSPIYEFVRSGTLDLALHDRRYMSGQVEAPGHNWRALQRAFLARQQQQQQHSSNGLQPWPGQPPQMLSGSAVQVLAHASSELPQPPPQQQQQIVPPYAPSELEVDVRSSSRRKSLRPWSADDVRMAAGSIGNSRGPGGPTARHPLCLESAYGAVTGREATFSTCHDKHIGCVDYIWFTRGSSEGAPWRLLPLAVLQPPPLQTLYCALPSPDWPSDHVALVCDFALLPSCDQHGQHKSGQHKGACHAHL